MLSTEEQNRYSRHIILPEIGIKGQKMLKQAKVLVIGAGGLGCPVLQYLAAAGVGNIGIVDDDKVDESNLQRQILYSTEDIGKYKATLAKEKLSRQNPFINLTSHITYLTSKNAIELISQYDIIVDGSDNFQTRYLVNDACVILNKPLVFGSIFKFEGQLSVFNFKQGPTYRCLFPTPPAASDVPNCSEAGVVGVLPGIVGTLQANEVIKIITGIGDVLSGKLLTIDALTMNIGAYIFETVPENKNILSLSDYTLLFNTPIREIAFSELKQKIESKEQFQLIDVRELEEYQLKNIGGELIPLHELLSNLERISKDIPVIIHCQSGARSKKAVELLMRRGYENTYSLKGGLIEISDNRVESLMQTIL